MAGGVPAGRLSIEIVAEIARLQQDLDKAKRAVKAASGDIAASAKAANDNLAGMASGIGKAGNQSKLAGHHMQNLAFQLQDIAIGLQGGQKPMTVFLQQGSQIAGIMAQAQMGVLGMTKAIAGMGVAFVASNPLILAAVGVAGLLAAGLGLVTEEINKNSSVTVTWQDVLLGAFDVVKEAISSRVTAAFEAMGLKIGDVWDFAVKVTKTAINLIIGASLAVPKLIAATYDKIGPAFGDAFYRAANLAIEALNWLVQKSAAPLNMLIGAMNSAFGTQIPQVVLGGVDKLANPYAGAMAALGKAGAGALVESFTTDWVAKGDSLLSEASQNRARMREAAEKAGEKAGKAGGAKMGKAMAEKAAKEVEDRFGIELSKSVMALYKKAVAGLDKTTIQDISEQINKGIEQRFDDAADAAARLNEQLQDTIANLRAIGGLGGPLADALSFLNGNFGGVSGKLGAILNSTFNKKVNGEDVAVKLGDELKRVFGLNGDFGRTLSTVFQNAGFGVAVGTGVDGILGAVGVKSSKLGAQIGGAIGSAFGPIASIAGSILGGLAGGLLKKTRTASATITGVDSVSLSGKKKGSYDEAGSLADSVISGLQQIADAFGADIGAFNTSIGLRGKDIRVNTSNSSLKSKNGAVSFGEDAAAAVAYALMDAIKDGAFKGLSKGVENLLTKSGGDLEKQLQKALDFKSVFDYVEQQADPTAYALKQFGTELDYLKGVFTEAGASASDLAKLEEYSALRRTEIMEEANRKAEELLNERLGMEVTILGLQGKATEALALARQLERDALDETLRPLLDQTHALQDAAAYREMEIQLMEALGQSEAALAARRQQTLAATVDSLKPLQMAIWAAEDAKKAQEAASQAADEYNSKLSDARSVLVSAYNREASALQSVADRFRGFADTLREFRNDLYGADSGLSSTRSLLVNLMKVGAQAAAGSETGLQGLPGAGRDYLSSLRNTASSAQEYARGVAMVARYADQGVSAASGRVREAEQQIALLHAQVSKLVDLDEGTVSLNEAMLAVKDLLANPVAPVEPTPVALPDDFVSQSYDGQREQTDALHKIERTQSERLERLSGQVEKQNAIIATMASNIASMAGVIKGAQRSGNTLAMVDETP